MKTNKNNNNNKKTEKLRRGLTHKKKIFLDLKSMIHRQKYSKNKKTDYPLSC